MFVWPPSMHIISLHPHMAEVRTQRKMSASPSLLCEQVHQYYFSRFHLLLFSSVQSLSRVRLFATPWTAAPQASLSFTSLSSQSLFRLVSIESMMLSNHLILCHPLLLLSSIFSSIGVFSNESVLSIRWPNYWSFSFTISLSNEYLRLTGLISLQSKGLKSLQHHSTKASIF